MATTDKRQITFIVRGILQKHGIDLLILEIDLIDALDRYVVGRKSGRDISELRETILADMIQGAAHASARDLMEGRIKMALGIDPQATPSAWDTVINFLIKADARGETIEKFATACAADPYGMPKTHQIANKPAMIQAVWLKVFKVGTETAKPDTDGGYR